MNWMINNLGMLSEASIILTAIVALIALAVAIKQLKQNALDHRESTAKGIYKEYLKMAIEYPVHAAWSFKIRHY